LYLQNADSNYDVNLKQLIITYEGHYQESLEPGAGGSHL
jgi:hypothetical protein